MPWDSLSISLPDLLVGAAVAFVVSALLRQLIAPKVADTIGFIFGAIIMIFVLSSPKGFQETLRTQSQDRILPTLFLAIILISPTRDIMENYLKPWRLREATVFLVLIPTMALYVGLGASGLLQTVLVSFSGVCTIAILGSWIHIRVDD